ncbi:MAG: inorganic phosphate transporter [Clostridiales bacterium]|nr:inorganic phosphate transporter [Clostridiales bacterium]
MIYLILTIGLITAFINGAHDGGTIVATSITARLITQKQAAVLSGLCNFAGAVVLGTAVAYTIASGLLDTDTLLADSGRSVGLFVLAAFIGSIIWNVFTWIVSLPSSASHSMIGAMVGCGIAGYGLDFIHWDTFFIKIILAMLISPIIGFAAGYVLIKAQNFLLRNATIVWNRRIRVLEIISTALETLFHGSNDAQKVIGLTAIGIAGCKGTDLTMPLWLILACSAALALGTMCGGSNMIRAVGKDIIKVDSDKAFASQLASILVTEFSNLTGLPISSTQIITGSVMGVGTENTPKSVNWSVSGKIAISWITTIPASALMGALILKILTSVVL